MNPATTQDPVETGEDHEGSTPDVAAAAVAQIAAHELKQGQARAEMAMLSPLDASLRRGNPRQPAKAPSLFDARDTLALVPVSLQPAIITSDDHYTDDDASIVSPAVAALEAMNSAVAQVIAARAAIQGNITLSEGQQVLAVAELHDKLAPAALRRGDAALASLKSSIRSIETELAAPVQASAHNPVSQEVRAFLRSLPESKRLGVVMQAMNDGCATTAGAVLAQGLPAYLTGLPSDSIPVLLKTWQRNRNPAQAKRLELLRSVEAKVIAAGSQFIGLTDRMVGSHYMTVGKLRGAQAALRKVTGAIA